VDKLIAVHAENEARINARKALFAGREELLSRCGWSPFEGWSLTGWPLVTIVAGQLAWKDGAIQPEVRDQELTFNA